MKNAGIWVDGDYIWWAFPRINLSALKTLLLAGRTFAFGFWFQAYAGDEDLNRKQGFFRVLQGLGFTVYPVPLKTNADGKKKSRVDAFLSAEISRRLLAEELGNEIWTDTFILVSGDADFEPILRLAKERGRRIEVAHGQGLSPELKALADRLIDLENFRKELLRDEGEPKPIPNLIEWIKLQIKAAEKIWEIQLYPQDQKFHPAVDLILNRDVPSSLPDRGAS
jgi:uncharacterized LabA/DUF88 family protein